jgi:hypothetical protein
VRLVSSRLVRLGHGRIELLQLRGINDISSSYSSMGDYIGFLTLP